MDTWVWIGIIAAIVIVVALIAWAATRKRRTDELRDRFGPESTARSRATGAAGRANRNCANGWNGTTP